MSRVNLDPLLKTVKYTNNFSSCIRSTAWIVPSYTWLTNTSVAATGMGWRWARNSEEGHFHSHSQLYLHSGAPVLWRRLFPLCISHQVIDQIYTHYSLVKTTTRCSGSCPFWPKKHLFEGTSVTLRIQRTRVRILTHHYLFLSQLPLSISKED